MGTVRTTRRRSAAALVAILLVIGVAGPGSLIAVAAVPEGGFTDVPDGHRFAASIEWLVGEGITGGYDDGTFRPTAPVSRQAAAAFLFRWSGSGVTPAPCAAAPFPDVPTTHRFCGEIAWLVDEGLATGYPDGLFRPTAPVSRQAAAAFLWGLAHPDADEPPACAAAPFPDVPATHRFCAEITWFRAAGTTTGYPDGGFRPTVPVERQAMAAFLHRLVLGHTTSGLAPGAFRHASDPDISTDGRWVVFEGYDRPPVAMVPEITDVFLLDRDTGIVTRVSEAPDGTEGDEDSFGPSVSDDGRYVAYTSSARNIVAEDPNGISHVYLWDRDTDTTTLVSATPEGDVTRGFAKEADISADGRYVTFVAATDDLVEGDTNGQADVFVWDRVEDTTVRVSVGAGGTQADRSSNAPVISADGGRVAFATIATTLDDGPDDSQSSVYLWDRTDGFATLVSAPVADPGGLPPLGHVYPGSYLPAISGDGRVVAYQVESKLLSGDYTRSIRVWDENMPPLTPGGPPGSTLVSASFDGSGPLEGFAQAPALSSDGRYVGYHSDESLLVPGDTNGDWDVFVRDRHTATTRRVSVATDGVQGDDGSGPTVSLSGDGRFVAFDSWATNLAPGDELGRHIFLWDRGA